MVRVVVPEADSGARLCRIERAAFPDRETPRTAEDFARIGEPPSVAILADEAIARGFLILSFAADEAEIIDLGVVPEARREGLARALLKTGEALAAERGAARLFLEVAVDNAPARALYLGLGYAEIGSRKAYYHRPDGSRVDALIMGKDLAVAN